MLNSIYPILLVFETALAMLIAFIIYRIDPDYYLNRFFAILVFCLSQYFLWESFIYLPAPPILFLANLYRDISLAAAIFSAYLFFLASYHLQHGKENIESRFNIATAVITIVLIVLANLNDWVEPITTHIQFGNTPNVGIFLTYGIPVVYILLGSFTYIQLYRVSKGRMRIKLLYFLGSIFCIATGIIYYATFKLFGIDILLGDLSGLIGTFFYSIGLLGLLLAFLHEGE